LGRNSGPNFGLFDPHSSVKMEEICGQDVCVNFSSSAYDLTYDRLLTGSCSAVWKMRGRVSKSASSKLRILPTHVERPDNAMFSLQVGL